MLLADWWAPGAGVCVVVLTQPLVKGTVHYKIDRVCVSRLLGTLLMFSG